MNKIQFPLILPIYSLIPERSSLILNLSSSFVVFIVFISGGIVSVRIVKSDNNLDLKHENKLDFSFLSPSIYSVKIYMNNTIINKRIVIQ